MRTTLPPLVLVCLFLCMGLPCSPTHATDVPVAFEYTANAGCVTSFTVKPGNAVINSWLHKISPRKVVWSPIPATGSQKIEGLSWRIEEDKKNPNEPASVSATCTGRIMQAGGKHTCIPELNWSSLTGHWDYKVTATKPSSNCQAVTVDPAIIFRGGGGALFSVPCIVVVAGLLVLLVAFFRIMRKK